MPLRMRGQRAAASMVGELGFRNDHGASERASTAPLTSFEVSLTPRHGRQPP
jgi:hypothetical protein